MQVHTIGATGWPAVEKSHAAGTQWSSGIAACEFDHGEVAAYFLANHAKVIPTLSAAALDRFEKCIDALVAALPAVKKP